MSSFRGGSGGQFMWRTGLVCGTLLGGCAQIEHTQQLQQPVGQRLATPVGGTLATIGKQKDLPNVFGKADLYGRKVDTGFIKIVYRGRAEDGGVLVEQVDVDVHSNASVLTRMPSTYSSSTSAMVHGNAMANAYGGSATVTGSAHGYGMAMAPHAETNIVLPPTATKFHVPNGKTLTLSTGQVIEFLEVQPHQVSYKISLSR